MTTERISVQSSIPIDSYPQISMRSYLMFSGNVTHLRLSCGESTPCFDRYPALLFWGGRVGSL